MEILDTKHVDVKLIAGDVHVVVATKSLILDKVKPVLEGLKAKIPGKIDDALIDMIVAEIEKVEAK